MAWKNIDMDAGVNSAEDTNQGSGDGAVVAGSTGMTLVDPDGGSSPYPNELWVENYHKGRAVPIYIKSSVTGDSYLKYPGTLSETLSRSSTIPLHKVEENFDIGDHISVDACTVSARLTLVRELGMRQELEAMVRAKELVSVRCSLGEFLNMGIVALDFRETGFQNTLECDIKFLEVRVGTTQWVQDTGITESVVKGSGSSTKTMSENDDSYVEMFR